MNRPVNRLLILGVALTFAPALFALLLTAISMILAFHDLSLRGIADPQQSQLPNHIGFVLVFSVAGVVLSAIGIIMLIVAGLLGVVTRSGRRWEG
jgi:hypothetical protein